MSRTTTCPDNERLTRLATATLPAGEMETLLQHLTECDACLTKTQAVSDTDTLLKNVAKAQTFSGAEQAAVTQLVERLSKLERSVPQDGGPKITFLCPSCGLKLKVKLKSAGKKVKCPGCAIYTQAPAAPGAAQPAAASPAGSEQTVPPTPGALEQTATEAHGAGEPKTRMPDSPKTANGGGRAQEKDATRGEVGNRDDEILDFLQPPQGSDELGRLEQYRILKKLGAGGMGMVLLAEDTRLHRKVALKVMLPAIAANATSRERFLREARSAASIEHEHVVPIFQVSKEDDAVPFLAMPLLKGEPLDARLDREKKLPVDEALRIAAEMAEGLAAAHVTGLIHRDIKPGNIWLEGDQGKVKLLDFGLARTEDENQKLTQTGALVGTPAFMAPEQAKGGKLDPRADLFSLGCVLYVMLTGQRPFKGESTIMLLTALALETPLAPALLESEVPEAVSALTMRLLEKNPDDRPASAADVVRELQALRGLATSITTSPKGGSADTLIARSSPATQIKPRPAVASSRRRNVGIAAAVLIGCLGLIGLLFGGTIIRVVTNKGELVIETADPNIEVTIKGDDVILFDKAKERRYVLTAGEYDVDVREEGNGGLRFSTKKLTITRGGTETFHVRLELAKASKQMPPASGPADDSKSKKDPPKLAPGASPLDRLDPASIPESDRRPWLPKEAVAIVGTLNGRAPTYVAQVALSRDGKWLAANNEIHFNLLQIYEMPAMKLRWELGGGRGELGVDSVRFLDDDKLIVTTNRIDSFAGRAPQALALFEKDYHHIIAAPRGAVFAGRTDRGAIHVYEWQSGSLKKRHVIDESPDRTLVEFLGDEHTLLTNDAGALRIWDLREGKAKLKAEVKGAMMGAGTLSADGKTLAAFEPCANYHSPERLTFWDMSGATPKRKRTLDLPNMVYRRVALTPDAKAAAIVFGRHEWAFKVEIWPVESEAKVPLASTELLEKVRSLTFADNGTKLVVGLGLNEVSGMRSGAISVLDFDGSKLTPRYLPHWCVSRPIFSPDGSTLATNLDYGNSWWDLTGTAPRERKAPEVDRRVAGFSAHGMLFIHGGGQQWEWDGEQARFFSNCANSLNATSLDGLTRASFDADGLGIHQKRDGKWQRAAHFPGALDSGASLTLRPDGKAALTRRSVPQIAHLFQRRGDVWSEVWQGPYGRAGLAARCDRMVRVVERHIVVQDFSTSPAAEIARVHCEEYPPEATAISPQGDYVAFAQTHAGTAVYKVATGERLYHWATLPSADSLEFAPDGRHLAIGLRHGVILMLRLDLPGSKTSP